MDTVINFLTDALENILRKFRAANAKVFLGIQVVIVALYFTGDALLDATTEEGVLLVASEAVRTAIDWVSNILVIIAAIIGVKLGDNGNNEGTTVKTEETLTPVK